MKFFLTLLKAILIAVLIGAGLIGLLMFIGYTMSHTIEGLLIIIVILLLLKK